MSRGALVTYIGFKSSRRDRPNSAPSTALCDHRPSSSVPRLADRFRGGSAGCRARSSTTTSADAARMATSASARAREGEGDTWSSIVAPVGLSI